MIDKEYYVAYYTPDGKYASTKFFQDYNVALDAKQYYEDNGYVNVKVVEFRYS